MYEADAIALQNEQVCQCIQSKEEQLFFPKQKVLKIDNYGDSAFVCFFGLGMLEKLCYKSSSVYMSQGTKKDNFYFNVVTDCASNTYSLQIESNIIQNINVQLT